MCRISPNVWANPTSFPRSPGIVSAPNTATGSRPSIPESNEPGTTEEMVRTCQP